MNANLINANANLAAKARSRTASNSSANLLHTRSATRLAGLAAALLLSVCIVGALTQSMNIDRFGKGAPLVQLEAVVVTPAAVHPAATEIARADAEGVKRQTN